MCNLVSLTKNCGTYVPAGLSTTLYLIPYDEITTWPSTRKEVVEAASGTPEYGDEKIFDEAFTLVSTSGLGYFRQIPILVNSSDLRDTLEGDIGGQKYVQRLDFQVQGSDSERLAFADCLLQSSGCLVPMIAGKDGLMHVLAKKDYPAHLEAAEGGPGGDLNAFTYTIYNDMGLTHMLYDANEHGITITPNA